MITPCVWLVDHGITIHTWLICIQSHKTLHVSLMFSLFKACQQSKTGLCKPTNKSKVYLATIYMKVSQLTCRTACIPNCGLLSKPPMVEVHGIIEVLIPPVATGSPTPVYGTRQTWGQGTVSLKSWFHVSTLGIISSQSPGILGRIGWFGSICPKSRL